MLYVALLCLNINYHDCTLSHPLCPDSDTTKKVDWALKNNYLITPILLSRYLSFFSFYITCCYYCCGYCRCLLSFSFYSNVVMAVVTAVVKVSFLLLFLYHMLLLLLWLLLLSWYLSLSLYIICCHCCGYCCCQGIFPSLSISQVVVIAVACPAWFIFSFLLLHRLTDWF